jgi:glyoxylase-like metal-dependent hydrolase (beta-lactamase superfamily II)
MIRFELGNLRLTLLDGGTLRQDGGAMFGVVPKVLWGRERVTDEQNRIELALHLLLVEDGKTRTLIDTGAGTKLPRKMHEIYALSSRSAEEILEPAGLRPDQVDRVINTHLHFDHAGGNTEAGEDGAVCAVFPNAEYVVQRAELAAARLDHERTRAAYVADDFEPLDAESGRLRIVDGDLTLDDHLVLRLAPGHTPGLQIVLVTSRAGTVAFMADLVPMSSHLPAAWIMAFDLEPLTTLASKKRLLAQAVAEDWRLVFQHDPLMPLATIEASDGRLRARAWHPAGEDSR